MECLGDMRLISGAYEELMGGNLETTLVVGGSGKSKEGGGENDGAEVGKDVRKEEGRRVRVAGEKNVI